MRKDVFITGTDTGVGKTIVAGLLLRFLREKGLNAVTQKWVQTGSYDVSEDVRAHMGFIDGATESMKKYAEDIAPYIFRFPASPHLAASLENVEISFEKIERCFKRLSSEFDRVIVEGSGGIMVPLSGKETFIDAVEKLGLPVIMVAENRLGAINQSLLTLEALRKHGIRVIGTVFNRSFEKQDIRILEDNKTIVEKLSGIRTLGEIKFSADRTALCEKFVPIGEAIEEELEK